VDEITVTVTATEENLRVSYTIRVDVEPVEGDEFAFVAKLGLDSDNNRTDALSSSFLGLVAQ
jgi:hypothetical protein